MLFDRRRTAVVLHILLTAQFAQAGPLRWTDRIYPREVGTPANSDNIVSVEATAAADSSENNSGGSETTPRPIFQTLTSSIIFPESLIPKSSSVGDSSADTSTVDLVPIKKTSTTDYQIPVVTTSVSSVVEETTEQLPTSTPDAIASTNLAVTPTITTSIVPQQPSDTTSAVVSSTETTTAVQQTPGTTTVVEKTSEATSLAVETSESILTTSIVPKQPSTETTSVELVETTTSALETPLTRTAVEETTQSILTTSIVPKQPSTETTSAELVETPTSAVDTPRTTSAAEETTQSILTTSIVPKDPATELSSTPIETPGLSTSVPTYSAPVNTPSASSARYATASTPGELTGTAPASSYVNTPATTFETVPASSTDTPAPVSTIYHDTPSAPGETTSTALPDTSTVPDEGVKLSTTASLLSSVDLGDIKPTTTHSEQTNVVQEPSTAVVPTTSAVDVSLPVTTSVVETPKSSTVSSVGDGLPETSAAVPETTLTVSVVDPSETGAASSTEVETSSSEPVSTSEAVAAPSTTSAAFTTVPEVVATGTPDTAVPDATPMPTGTTTVDAERYASNLAQAKKLNKVYSNLTPASACSSGQAACIDGKFAQCSNTGTYTLSACGDNRQCYALPMTTNRGVRLGCEDVDTAEKILGETGSGQETSFTVEEPASTSVAEAPVSTSVVEQPATTSTAEEQNNVPVVTVTEIVTVDDGATESTSQPVAEESTSSAQEVVVPTTTSEPSSEQPVNEQPTQTTSVYSAPESTVPINHETTVVTSEVPIATTSAPVAEVPTTAAFPSGNTLTKSIKVPEAALYQLAGKILYRCAARVGYKQEYQNQKGNQNHNDECNQV
ncbi:carbohydrate-binding module family 19 protein [Ilyonectria robusta]